jgi:hypothetical protein
VERVWDGDTMKRPKRRVKSIDDVYFESRLVSDLHMATNLSESPGLLPPFSPTSDKLRGRCRTTNASEKDRRLHHRQMRQRKNENK